MEPDPKREGELHVLESEVAEQALRARVTGDADLLEDAKQRLKAIERELAGLRAARMGDGIDHAIATAAGTGPATETVEPATPERVQGKDRVIGSIADRLLQGMREAIQGAGDIIGAQLQPATVLGRDEIEPLGTESSSKPAILQMASGASTVLGDRVQTRVVVGDGLIRIWLAGVSSTLAGATVVAAAVTNKGEFVQARAVVRLDGAPIRLELPWAAGEAPPEQLAFAVERA